MQAQALFVVSVISVFVWLLCRNAQLDAETFAGCIVPMRCRRRTGEGRRVRVRTGTARPRPDMARTCRSAYEGLTVLK